MGGMDVGEIIEREREMIMMLWAWKQSRKDEGVHGVCQCACEPGWGRTDQRPVVLQTACGKEHTARCSYCSCLTTRAHPISLSLLLLLFLLLLLIFRVRICPLLRDLLWKKNFGNCLWGDLHIYQRNFERFSKERFVEDSLISGFVSLFLFCLFVLFVYCFVYIVVLCVCITSSTIRHCLFICLLNGSNNPNKKKIYIPKNTRYNDYNINITTTTNFLVYILVPISTNQNKLRKNIK